MRSSWLGIIALAVIAVACTGGGEPQPTASTRPLLTTTEPPAETTSTTATTLPPLTGATGLDYRIVRREPLEGLGDRVVVLVDAGGSAVSDLDVYDVITDVVERFPPIYEAYVVDDPTAVDLVTVEEPTVAERAILDEHLLARLVEGFRVVYEGPFADRGSAIIGS